jgi:uncharacterized membrane protein YfcA
MNLSTIFILIFIGLAAGLLSGMVGVGGGILMVPALVFFLGLSQHGAQGTSLAVMLPPVGILACMNYYKAGALNWKFALIIGITFVVGGYLGSKVAIGIDERMLKKVFGVVMLLAALKLIFGK